MRYDRYSSRSWGASDFRGSCGLMQVSPQFLQRNHRMVIMHRKILKTHKFDRNRSVGKNVDALMRTDEDRRLSTDRPDFMEFSRAQRATHLRKRRQRNPRQSSSQPDNVFLPCRWKQWTLDGALTRTQLHGEWTFLVHEKNSRRVYARPREIEGDVEGKDGGGGLG